jgi:hypothetical protein
MRRSTLEMIEWADGVATDYAQRGLGLTLRQLYYQGVSDNVFVNSDRSYDVLGTAVSRGRLAGMIDWAHLTDRARQAHGTGWVGSEFPTIEEEVANLEYGMTHDPWAGQEYRPEVWVEKQALEEVAEHATRGFRAAYIACKGYMSLSEMWEAGYNRLGDIVAQHQTPVILHIGDHDPSGIDMTRDIQERLTMFAGGHVEVRRLALNMDQIEEYNPPPNPAKLSDSRAGSYIENYGYSSWELDAIKPERLIEIVRQEISSLIDWDVWNERIEEERVEKAKVRAVSDRWDEIVEYLAENPVDDE